MTTSSNKGARKQSANAQKLSLGARKLSANAQKLSFGARKLCPGARKLCPGARKLCFRVIAALVLLAAALVSCNHDAVYYHYESTPAEGWERNDTLTFDLSPLDRIGFYDIALGLRSNGTYPFQSVTIIVDQTTYNARRHNTKGTTRSDTVVFALTDKYGKNKGTGLSLYQYEMPLRLSQEFKPGDSIHYAIRHYMRRNIIPGITDIGLKITRKP